MLESEHDIKKWKFKAPKGVGGAQDSGPLGGIYTLGEGDKQVTALIKREKNVAKVIAEYVASEIFAEFSPNNSAKIELIKTTDKIPDPTGENIYIASIFLKNYQDMFETLGLQERPKLLGEKEALNKLLNKKSAFSEFMEDISNDPKQRKDFANIMSTSLLTGDFDVHIGNVGIINGNKLVRIDYGAALDGLENDIHPHSRSKHLPGLGPTNHFREYPRNLRVSQEMVDEAMKNSSPEAQKKMEDGIKRALENVGKYYGIDPIKSFAEMVGMPKSEINAYKNWSIKGLTTNLATFMVDKMHARQSSLREFGCEIAVDLALQENKPFKDNPKFMEVLKENKEYFKGLVNGDKEIHFRNNENKLTPLERMSKLAFKSESNLEKRVKTQISEAFNAIKEPVQPKATPKTDEKHWTDKTKKPEQSKEAKHMRIKPDKILHKDTSSTQQIR